MASTNYPASLDAYPVPNNGDTISVADHWLGPAVIGIENFVGISSNNRLVPVGSIMPYSSDTEPAGWFICDGRTVSRTTYADLFSALSTVWGYGDNSTTFNIPDFRGRFLRGHDDGAGRDPDAASRTASNTGGATGDNVGSVQGYGVQDHNHVVPIEGGSTYAHYVYQTSGWPWGVRAGTFSSGGHSTLLNNASSTGNSAMRTSGVDINDPSSITSFTSSPTSNVDETRPINANVNYIIKY